MAGHSQFKNIMYRKGAQDKKRGKMFTKVIREITVAAKEGGVDPESNPRLRSAIVAAKAVNMPKDNIDRALKKVAGGDDGTTYEEMRYEGYGPGGVAVIVEALTDNRNRTASEVRSTFSKYGGNLGETNSVSFQFDRIGTIVYSAKVTSGDEMFEAALEAGASDVESTEAFHEVRCAPDDLHQVLETLTKAFGEPDTAKLTWQPKNTVPVEEDHARTLLKLLDILEDNDDVQQISANYEIDDTLMKTLEE